MTCDSSLIYKRGIKVIGHRISVLIKAKRMTQKSIAKKIGMSEQALGQFLSSKTEIHSSSLDKLLLHLGIDLAAFVVEETNRTMPPRLKIDSNKGQLRTLQKAQAAKLAKWVSEAGSTTGGKK